MPDQSGVCAINNGGCSPDALCMDIGGVAACQCMPGFTGTGQACAACTVCDVTQFATVPCGPTMDAVCAACAPACETGMFEAQPCGPLTDRVCSTCTSCGLDQYEVTPCNLGSDRTCATCTVCLPDQYVAAPCGGNVDTSCVTCDFGCATCGGPAQCTSCQPGFVPQGGTCVMPMSNCGNGVVEPGEMCDDGNPISGDGCSVGCTIEAGYYCFGDTTSFCRAGSCAVEPGTAFPLGGGFALDGVGSATGTGVHLTQRSTIHTTGAVTYPVMIEAVVTYSGPDTTYIGARGTGLRVAASADEPINSLRARLSAATVDLAAGDVVLDSVGTPFTPATGVPYRIRYVDDGTTATVEWINLSNPAEGIARTVGSTFHGGESAFVGGGDTGGVTIGNIRVCSAPTLPVTNGLVARYSGMRSWTAVQDGLGNVSTWQDESGLGHDLQVNGAAPVFSGGLVNGHGALDFAGGARLTSAPFALTTDVTVFAVIVHNLSAQWGAIAHHGDRDFDWSLEQSGGGVDELHWQTNNDNTNMNLTLVQGTSYVLTGRFAGTARYFSASTFDGAAPAEVSIVDASHSITTGSKNLYVGSDDVGSASNAYIADLVYYDRALSDGERDQVTDYLRRLWQP